MGTYAPHMEGPRSELTVTFADAVTTVRTDDAEGLVFGRGAALDIDSNPFLHRRVGRLVASKGIWWLENLSAWTSIRVVAEGLAVQLRGGARVALDEGDCTICFEAGSCNYELHLWVPFAPVLSDPPQVPDDLTATFRPVALPLTSEQRLLVLTLAEGRLRRPQGDQRLPSNQSAARRLGWSDAKFNRKLDHLCHRLDRAGVTGMRLEGRRANDRRRLLVDHMIDAGHVTAADLGLLGEYAPGREEGRA